MGKYANMTVEDVISRIREECDKLYEKYEGNPLIDDAYLQGICDATEYDSQEDKEAQRRSKIKANKLLIIGFISLLLCCFIPSTKEMYAIYGIGGVIDYVKGNEKTKKLPDKVIDALDKYLDEQKGEEE